ncbi:hypothetical protein [Bifidobacterium crudilactis]|jgi:predicted NAD-dependent protein-ADP-ribosyltransferase YbiA (DUF1768 family)|uniref:Uncharacterized protein n=1 Tax=Bifidobacterium crudilactis TaxID=327277 RepID=A0A971D031_9BIFI|nr:hypothetical protein [Bifidobacterium crudilactis]MCI1867708.1 hypothetical protein [Bifidobacterium crudilactis]MDN5973265.1 hypothetical protein [Bifidobacterium crudilactis]MDN6001706.1 hypothetical protein [Bifidobacterium crudilactis]MDN6210287.1 hypothetical protein [Bifidobacterium crudilactis]MDN6271512.1 hypothetical protein [Bifidobacterium crudilactis]
MDGRQWSKVHPLVMISRSGVNQSAIPQYAREILRTSMPVNVERLGQDVGR